jgi:hypothetical protein
MKPSIEPPSFSAYNLVGRRPARSGALLFVVPPSGGPGAARDWSAPRCFQGKPIKRWVTAVTALLAGVSLAAAADGAIAKTFQVEPGGRLEMDVDRGAIKVETSEGNRVEVEVEREVGNASAARAAEILNDHQVELSQEGNNVRIHARLAKPVRKGWFSLQPNLQVSYRIKVPTKFDASLKTGGGGITVTELRGRVEAQTGGGGLTLRRIEGPVDVRTGGGGIHAIECTDTLKLQTGGGGIDIERFSGSSVRAQTGGGSISAHLRTQPQAECSFRTGGGGIDLKVPASIAVELDAKTGGGKVSSALPVTTRGKAHSSTLQGTINGGGPVLSLRTGGGSIRLDLAAPD